MKMRPGQKIKLTSVEELLGVTNEESAMDLEIAKIRPFKDHPFKVLDDEKMQDLKESIRINGILSPVLVRPIGNDIYEMVSGHRRMHAAMMLGMDTVPAIIREMTDDEAVVKMVDANIQREELLPSEKAFAYKMKMDAMRRQGTRTDLNVESESTSAQIGRKLEAADIVGEQVGESRMQIRRYIRLTNLIPELLDYVDQKRIQFTVAVEISYIDQEVQKWLYEYIKDNGAIKLNQFTLLRTQLQSGAITQAKMISLLNDSQPGKTPSSKLTFTEKKLREYFPANYTTSDMRNVIEDLLEEWKMRHENDIPDDEEVCSSMEFNYYYGNQADLFSFIRIPKVMLTEESFSSLSIPAKVLYGVLLDRMTLSRKNGWFDEENRVFIIYQIDEIREDLGFSKKKAMDLLSELENFGLLEKRRRGHGLPNILYVKSFMTGFDADVRLEEKKDSGGSEKGTSRANSIDPRSAEIITSRSAVLGTYEVPNSAFQEVSNFALQEVPKSAPLKSNTDMNNNYRSNIESNHILSTGSDEIRCDERSLIEAEAYEQVIKENIGYEDLLISHSQDREMIEGMVSLILETVISRGESFVIAGNRYPSAVVKSRFLKLDYSHIEYVLFCLKRNTTKINNIKKYLLAALFNAPSTIGSYYQAEVNHDSYVATAGR